MDFIIICCIYSGEARVSTCSLYHKKMNEKKLCHERFNHLKFAQAKATCIDLSICGSFVYVGYTTGEKNAEKIFGLLRLIEFSLC